MDVTPPLGLEQVVGREKGDNKACLHKYALPVTLLSLPLLSFLSTFPIHSAISNSDARLQRQTSTPNSNAKLQRQTPTPNSNAKLQRQTPTPNSNASQDEMAENTLDSREAFVEAATLEKLIIRKYTTSKS
ncbi:hypothetical protein BDY17DRAFT_38300 [Neohortaea acidophila]|uniref:Uncharacterized protein n=1 Tax=Neohortaea acidophila TaxID=245834 RepID=A0A6A6PHE9_9PEZI|nr:uncharacterized protein BDY17DRAFT_38300 [Neohortaea acidophila]KAF2479420.1 hypothetical protein BDY17DRAFT_38300 [Neohortaea acidophila]